MRGEVTESIVEYMNGMSKKQFTLEEGKAIQKAIPYEHADRNMKSLDINSKSKNGREEINQRTALIANTILKADTIKAEHIHLFKMCKWTEFSDRTGKCAYGFKEMRERLGYDVITGLEIEE